MFMEEKNTNNYSIDQMIEYYSLENAIKFEGKANPKNIIGKVISEFPEVKKNMNIIVTKINEITNKINKLSIKEQEQEIKKYLITKEKPKEKTLKDLPNADKRPVIMRFEPSPSGPLHIGHAYPLSLNCAYVDKYNGKMILRISDTNPENIDPKAYDMIHEDGKWLMNDFEFYIQSDRLENYYKYAKILIEKNKAYVCTCESENFKKFLDDKQNCPCRDITEKEQILRWEKMFNEFKQGEAILRFKTDMKHKNPAMRDFGLMRINESEHPRQGKKFRVWPLMNFSVAIDDMETNISHTLRGKDHADNAKKQALIHEVLNYETPYAINVGRINFLGFPVSCSKTKVLINEGKYENWYDVRIPFIPSLKRRGYLPETLKKFAIEIGVTQTDKTVDINEYFKTINAINKSLLDPNSKRFFFVKDPIKIKIKEAPKQKLKLKLHPEKELGYREFKTNQEFYISKEDYENIMKSNDKEIFRLMDCLNFTKINDELIFHSLEYEKYKDIGKMIIHWLPIEEITECKIIMNDNNLLNGFCEKNIELIKNEDIIQFERFGFCKLEDLNAKKFIFAHK
jgi:glutamyl-tRNA synthetase